MTQDLEAMMKAALDGHFCQFCAGNGKFLWVKKPLNFIPSHRPHGVQVRPSRIANWATFNALHCHKWSEKEVRQLKHLRAGKHGFGAKAIAKKMGLSRSTIETKLRHLGLYVLRNKERIINADGVPFQ